MREGAWIQQRKKDFGGKYWIPSPEIFGEPPEASQIQDQIASHYEQKNGLPFIADYLGLKQEFKDNHILGAKIRAIDQFVQQRIQKENKRDSIMTYKEILATMVKGSLEEELRSGKAQKLLDEIFQHIGLLHGLSKETFIKKSTLNFKKERISFLKGQLKELLK